MSERIEIAGLRVDATLFNFIEDVALPGSEVDPDTFWQGFASLVTDMMPRNRALLAVRDNMQVRIDDWHRSHRSDAVDAAAYTAFLHDIGYLLPEATPFSIDTQGVDPEIATIAGPQLVVPVMNARFALNACNARWGSLYDALYGTDALGDVATGGAYDPARGARVVAWAKAHLDAVAPLSEGSWAEVTEISVAADRLVMARADAGAGLADPAQFAGFSSTEDTRQILLKVNGLLIELHLDPTTSIGSADPTGLSDIRLESALSTIMDCEDSVTAVDAEDKVLAYANWLGLMKGDLTETFDKGGETVTRAMNPDRTYQTPTGGTLVAKGRALMLVRNVGHLMTTPAILDASGHEIGEGLMDAMLTVLAACHDIRGKRLNSARGSAYVVKPKMHGPDEVAFADEIFGRVEQIMGLPHNTVKLGIMDEERRTSANLGACIHAARHRVAFINTGFLDRTGDEIHTSMEAGPMVPKGEMKSQPWIAAYEDRNVDIGLACGLQGRAQIGKGMWAMPDLMADMLDQKIGHPQSGASCAWVPSPTAATLHATHYHCVNVADRQQEIARGGTRATLADLLTLPVATGRNFSDAEIAHELDNNAQGILGYVVRWVDAGVGCSKVPDINDVALMEDRATCRISAQALANWLHHGLIDADQVRAAMEKMARVVDSQNAGDSSYTPMAPDFDGAAFRAALALVLDGRTQPSGYTEPLLHQHRLEKKAENV